jgi:tetratricopeptide (TPR) repeat protein
MDKTLGLCGRCGYGVAPQAASSSSALGAETTAAAPRRAIVVRFQPERKPVTEALADTYRQIALAESDMVAAATLLERLRRSLLTEPDGFEIWRAIDREVATADARTVRPALISLRDWYAHQLFSRVEDKLRESFHVGSAQAWREWLTYYAEAVARWRPLLCQRLVEMPLSFPEQFSQPFDFRKYTRLLIQQRWTELHHFLRYLGEQEFLNPVTRGQMLVMVGLIYLYQFAFADRAMSNFKQAEKLAPDGGFVLAAMGSYYDEAKDSVAATSYFEKSVQAAPDEANGYLGFGDMADKSGQVEDARKWYQEALNKAADDGSACARLIAIYGRPDQIERYESYIGPLAERAMAVDETGKYSLLVALGNAYASGKRFEDAHRWFSEAIALDPAQLAAYTAEGSTYLDGENNEDAAIASFRQAVEVAPEAYDGYWLLGTVYEKQEKWADAAQQYALAGERMPEFRAISLSKLGEMQWKLKQYDNAERTLFESLRLDSTRYPSALISIADEYYKTGGKPEQALKIYGDIRDIKGESFEATYHNQIGNLHFSKGRYDLAAQCYQRAIQADPATATYYSNFLQAAQELKDWDGARAWLKGVPEQIQKDSAVRAQLALIRNAEANAVYDQSEYAQAIELYRQAIEFSPEDAVLHSNLAGALEQHKALGPERYAQALEEVRKASQLDPARADFKRRIKRLEEYVRWAPIVGENVLGRTPQVTPIVLEVGSGLVPFFEGHGASSLSEGATKAIDKLRERTLSGFGLRIPGIRVRGNDGLPPGMYVISLSEIALVSGNAPLDKRLSPASMPQLEAIGVHAESTTNPETGFEAAWVSEADWEKVQSARLTLWEGAEYPIRHLGAVVERNLTDFIGVQEVSELVQQHCADRKDEIAKAEGGLPAFTRVVRALIAENVPIVAFKAICEFYLKNCDGTSVVQIVEGLRSLPEIRASLPGNSADVELWRMGTAFQVALANDIHNENAAPVLAMTPYACRAALTAIRNVVTDRRGKALVVDDSALRPFVRKLVEVEFSSVFVLSTAELMPDLKDRFAGEINL